MTFLPDPGEPPPIPRPPPLVVNTARLGYDADRDWLDVSLQGNLRRCEKGEKGGHRGIGIIFAPSPGLLYPFLKKRREGVLAAGDWERYAEAYRLEMRESYARGKGLWDCLLCWRRVVLLCFCKDHNECHRRLLAGFLVKLGAVDAGEIAA